MTSESSGAEHHPAGHVTAGHPTGIAGAWARRRRRAGAATPRGRRISIAGALRGRRRRRAADNAGTLSATSHGSIRVRFTLSLRGFGRCGRFELRDALVRLLEIFALLEFLHELLEDRAAPLPVGTS